MSNLTINEIESFYDISIELHDFWSNSNDCTNMRELPSIAYELSKQFNEKFKHEQWIDLDYLETIEKFTHDYIFKYMK